MKRTRAGALLPSTSVPLNSRSSFFVLKWNLPFELIVYLHPIVFQKEAQLNSNRARPSLYVASAVDAHTTVAGSSSLFLSSS